MLFALPLLWWAPPAGVAAAGLHAERHAVVVVVASARDRVVLSNLPDVLARIRGNDSTPHERRMALTGIGALVFLGFLFLAALLAMRN